MTIALTGSSGAIGSRVARGLEQRGVSYTPTTARYHQTEQLASELLGASTLLLISGRESATRVAEHYSAIEAALTAGVERIVYTSFFGAAPDCTFTLGRDHWLTERQITDCGLTATFLRDNLYQEVLPHLAGSDGVIRGPAGSGTFAPVSQDDVAAVALAALLDDAHADQTYNLSRPRALSLAAVAEILTSITGRHVSYKPETVEEAYASRAHYGAPDFEVDGWVTSYLAIANGDLAEVTSDVQDILRRPPKDLSELVL